MADVTGRVPDPAEFNDETDRKAAELALKYMGLAPHAPIESIQIDRVFIGSCTNGRIEDLRAAAKVVRGYQAADRVSAMVVPGSGLVKKQAEAEGLDKIFLAAGLEWREPGVQHVPGDESRPARTRRAWLPPATGISRAGRARGGGPTSSPPPWPPPPPSPATSSTSATGNISDSFTAAAPPSPRRPKRKENPPCAPLQNTPVWLP